MEYTNSEKQLLTVLGRTDFRNLSKNDLMSYASKLGELRPEVARDVIAQFPELASLIKTSLTEYKDMIDSIVASDDASITQAYDVFEQELTQAHEGRKEFIDMADKVRADISRCLNNSDLTPEERKEMFDREMEILRMVNQKDGDIREKEMEVVHLADQKDSEKRQFNWKLLGGASFVVLAAVGIGSAALGGSFNFKLPKKL